MRKPKIQNRIGRSLLTLPVCLLLAVGLWWLPQRGFSADYAAALLLVLLVAYVATETNSVFLLIRTQSRMVASVWLFGAATVGLLHPYQPSLFATLCLSVCYFLLFRTYQQPQSVADVFHLFAVLALAAIVLPPMLLLVPVFLWHMLVFMRSLSLRGLFAALVGLALPFWFWLGWMLWREDLAPLLEWYGRLAHQPLQGLAPLLHPTAAALVFCVLTFVALWTSVYYLLHSYDDKIRTRMMLYTYLLQSFLFVVYGLVVDVAVALPLLLLSVSPLAGHYFTLRNTWLCLVIFFLLVVAFLALGVLTLWPDGAHFLLRLALGG